MGYLSNNFYKKNKQPILKLATSPYIISLLITIIIIFFLPNLFKKYNIKTVQNIRILPGQRFYYADLNSDGISDQIEIRQEKKKFFYIIVRENDKVIDQWNFVGQIIFTHKLPVSKIRDKYLKAFYFFVYKDKKIYLDCLNPYKHRFITKNKFVANYIPKKHYLDCHIRSCTFFDSNSDSVKEFYFSSEVDYSGQPRRVYKYDPARDSIVRSVKIYANLNNRKGIVIQRSKSGLNLVFGTYATGNSDIKAPYSDMYSWLMDYSKNLNFKYKPVKTGLYPSETSLVPLNKFGKAYYIIMNLYDGTKKHFSSLRLFNAKLKIIREKKFKFSSSWRGAALYSNPNQPKYFYIIKKNGQVNKYNDHFRIIKTQQLPKLTNGFPIKIDVNNNHQTELIFRSRDHSHFIITRDDFSGYSLVKCYSLNRIRYYGVKLNGAKSPELVTESKNEESIYSYRFDKLYFLKYPAYLTIYLLTLSVMIVIEKAQKHRVELKYNTEKRIAELQLLSIKNQIDPHFTLNTLNSIGSLIYKKDHEKADYVFSKYSKLLRLTILNSDKITTTLSGELDYVENYLELEQYRYENKFDWEINVNPTVKRSFKIPKMLIYKFVENAIKHGLKHRLTNGKLKVSVHSEGGRYRIKIRDNGVGRAKAEQVEWNNTGKGLHILDQMLDLYENLMNIRITYVIHDMVDEFQKPSGTKVEIKIPVE